MSNKLYVGGLPYSITEGRLEEIFAEHGTVESARVISDKFTGQSRGFGFVEMSSSEEAQKAIAALNDTQLDGRTLVVNEARPQEKRFGGGGGDRGDRGDRGGGGGGGRRGGGRNRW
ncbi:MAG: RNA-binding protein [Deltaproteobacteria bacterium]|nr:RNA-binding protein [Deltaproteobacteria bacterium]